MPLWRLQRGDGWELLWWRSGRSPRLLRGLPRVASLWHTGCASCWVPELRSLGLLYVTQRSSAENREVLVRLQSPACQGNHGEVESSSPAGPVTVLLPFLTKAGARSPRVAGFHSDLCVRVCVYGVAVSTQSGFALQLRRV